MAAAKYRLTICRTMVWIAFVAVSLASFRLHPVVGVVVSSVSYLALLRTFQKLDVGPPISSIGLARTFLASVGVSLAILGCSIVPAYFAHATVFEWVPTSCGTPREFLPLVYQEAAPMAATTLAASLFKGDLW